MNNLPTSENAQYWEYVDRMRNIAAELLEERRQDPEEHKDILNVMINGRDPKTGEGLSDDSILDNMMTFLVAGERSVSNTSRI